MQNSSYNSEKTVDFFFLKDGIKSLTLTVCGFALVIMGIIIYSYINFWGIPSSFDAFISRFEFNESLRIQAAVLIAAFLVIICAVISYFARKDCYIDFKETALCGKLPAFPCRAKHVEIPYDEIIRIKRGATSRTGGFGMLIVITTSGKFFIPHNSQTKIRKIENLLYEMKG